MNDDEVFEIVKKTLSDVQMDRPIEAIEQRGRSRKRNRGVFAAVAGGALAATAAISLTLAGGGNHAATTTAQGSGATSATSAPVMQEAAYTVTKLANGSVGVKLNSKLVLDPSALQKALAAAGVPAKVESGKLCRPKGAQLPEANEVLLEDGAKAGQDGPFTYKMNISPAKMPKGSVIYFSVFDITGSGHFDKFALFLVKKGAAMDCRTIG
jgi:hypothetical protein